MAPGVVEFVFKLAEKYFPVSTILNYNDTTGNSWGDYHGAYTPNIQLVKRLQNRNLRVDCLGLQYHMFMKSPEAMLKESYDQCYYNKGYLLERMDASTQEVNIPLNISEITVPGNEIFGGEDVQCAIVEQLYRIWFSHPMNTGIIWWNMLDATSPYTEGVPKYSRGENWYQGGILRYDFKEKAVARMLYHLIHEEWHTDTVLDYEDGKLNQFHGFYGDYDMDVSSD